jgi:hypothetical protein
VNQGSANQPEATAPNQGVAAPVPHGNAAGGAGPGSYHPPSVTPLGPTAPVAGLLSL